MLHPATPRYMLHATDVMTATTHMISATSELENTISMCCQHINTRFTIYVWHYSFCYLLHSFIGSCCHTAKLDSYGELIVAQLLGTIQVSIKTSPAGCRP
jgi:hypothetical protein